MIVGCLGAAGWGYNISKILIVGCLGAEGWGYNISKIRLYNVWRLQGGVTKYIKYDYTMSGGWRVELQIA